MADHIRVPIKKIGTGHWGQLNMFGDAHLICGESVKLRDEKFTLAGQHRVRLYMFKKNVHWRIPDGLAIDISAVEPSTAPLRRPQRS
jgi:hypothetical protein